MNSDPATRAATETCAGVAAASPIAAGLGIDRGEARLGHREHRLGERVALAGRDGAEQLLQVEGVAGGLLDDARDDLGRRGVAERGAGEALAGAAGQRAEAQLVHAAIRPEIGEERADLGAPDGDHHERALGQELQRAVDQRDRRQVAPVQVLQHDHERIRGALGRDEILPGAADLIAHQDGVPAGGAEHHAGVVGEVRPHDLAEELRDAGRVGAPQAAAGAGEEPVPPLPGRLALAQARGAAHELRGHAERRARAHRIAARDPDLGAALEAADELPAARPPARRPDP